LLFPSLINPTSPLSVPQEIRSFGDHVLKVSKGELAVPVKVRLLDGLVTDQGDLLRGQLPFGQLVNGLLQVLLTDEVVPVEIWATTSRNPSATPLASAQNVSAETH
jgi:hypothetical protein